MKRVSRIIIIFLIASLLACPFMFCSAASAADDKAETARHELALHYFRGVVNMEAGNYEAATEEFSAVAAIDPYYKDTQKYMARLDALRKDRKDAASEFKDESGTDLYLLGKRYYEQGNYERALQAFEAVLDKNPNDKFALYYKQLIEESMPKKGKRAQGPKDKAKDVSVLEQEVNYIKDDVQERQDLKKFLEEKAKRRAERDEMVRKKKLELERQEEILEEERQDYLAQADIAKRSEKLSRKAEKWRNRKEQLSSSQPGVPADLADFPVYQNRSEEAYKNMKENLRQSRWNSAALNAIRSVNDYCDAILIYYYEIKSSYPEHDNLIRLMAENIKRSDLDENLSRLRAIYNTKELVEKEDRPYTRTEAIFVSEKAERVIEWCRSVLP